MPFGTPLASTPMNLIPVNGIPSTSSTTTHAVAIGTGRRITACDSRYHGPSCCWEAVRSAARRQRAGESELIRGPSTASIAGRATSATVTATSAVIAPPSPIETRNGIGITHSVASASATVTAL